MVRPLHGLPVAVKDLHETNGIRTTFGSPLHKITYRTLIAGLSNGRKTLARSSLARQTSLNSALARKPLIQFFGPTRNPFDLTKNMRRQYRWGFRRPRLRNGSPGRRQRHGRLAPQSCQFLQRCRPSPVARTGSNVPTQLGWFTLSVPGPVARNVTDCAFFLSVLAGFDHHSPISIDQPGTQFAQPLAGRDFKGATCGDVQGHRTAVGTRGQKRGAGTAQSLRVTGLHSRRRRTGFLATPMNASWHGGIGRQSSLLAICWLRTATNLTTTSIGTSKRGES